MRFAGLPTGLASQLEVKSYLSEIFLNRLENQFTPLLDVQ